MYYKAVYLLLFLSINQFTKAQLCTTSTNPEYGLSCPSFANGTYCGPFAGYTAKDTCNNKIVFSSPNITENECINTAASIQSYLGEYINNLTVSVYNINTDRCPYSCVLGSNIFIADYIKSSGTPFEMVDCGDVSVDIAGSVSAALTIGANLILPIVGASAVGGVVATGIAIKAIEICCVFAYGFDNNVCKNFTPSVCLRNNTMSAPAPSSPSDSGNGIGCIASHQLVTTRNGSTKTIKQLSVGDNILTDAEWSSYIGNIHEESIQPTLIIHTEKSSVEVTSDHLIKTRSGFIHAYGITVGDALPNGKVISIHNGTSHVMSPLTKSGTLIVDGFILSCYANVYSHTVARIVTFPLNTGILKDVSMYLRILVKVYNNMPIFVKKIIACNDIINL